MELAAYNGRETSAAGRKRKQADATIYKANYIRGFFGKTIDEAFSEHLGRAFASEARAAG